MSVRTIPCKQLNNQIKANKFVIGLMFAMFLNAILIIKDNFIIIDLWFYIFFSLSIHLLMILSVKNV
jgi:hypothetical protein